MKLISHLVVNEAKQPEKSGLERNAWCGWREGGEMRGRRSLAKHMGYLQSIGDKEDILYPSQVLFILFFILT